MSEFQSLSYKDALQFLTQANYYMWHGFVAFETVKKAVRREEDRWRRALGPLYAILEADAPAVDVVDAFGCSNGHMYAGYIELHRGSIVAKSWATCCRIFYAKIARHPPSRQRLKRVLAIMRDLHDAQAFKDSMRAFAAIIQ